METKFDKYDVYISKRKDFKGGGIAVFVSKILSNVIYNIEINLDECIALLMKKSYLNTDKDIVYYFPYIPHEYSTVFQGQSTKGMERLIELYDRLFIKYGDIHWVIGGDLNARTGNLSDLNHTLNIDSFLYSLNGAEDLFDDISIKPRVTRDPLFVNNYGKQLIEFCKFNSLCILNGRTSDDKMGHITCIANKGKTIVDYFIVSINLLNFVNSFKVTPRHESDHFPISIVISGNAFIENKMTVNNNSSTHYISSLTWDSSKKDEYVHQLNLSLENNNETFMNSIKNNDINTASSIISKYVMEATNQMQKKNDKRVNKTNTQPKWWDNSLTELKLYKYKCLHNFHQSSDTAHLNIYLQSKRSLKKCLFSKTERIWS